MLIAIIKRGTAYGVKLVTLRRFGAVIVIGFVKQAPIKQINHIHEAVSANF